MNNRISQKNVTQPLRLRAGAVVILFIATKLLSQNSQLFNIFRAPVLVALALIELGMKYEDAVELIRE